MRKFAGGILFRDKFSRPQLVEFVVLGAIAVASFLLMVFLPISRVYCAIALIIVIICGLRLWRLLPSDRRRVLREAHQMADAMLLARRSTNAATMMALSTQLPPSQAALTQAPFMPLAQCAPSMQSGFGQVAALPTQQLLATSMGFPYRQNQVLMMNSMARPSPQQQQAMLSTSMAQPSPQQQQAMLSTSMARPSPQQQQAMLSTSMARPLSQQQQAMLSTSMARPLSQQQQAMLSTSMAQPSPQQQQAMLSTSMARPLSQQQQAMLSTSMAQPSPQQQQAMLSTSMAQPSPQQQQAMLSTSMARPSPQQQQAMLSTSMARPLSQQQQAMLSTSMAQPSPQQQQEMMANTPTQAHPVRFVLQQASRVPEALSPKNQHSTGAGNRLPKQRQDLRSKTQFG
ncbi:hypothetical protein C4B63_259g12 [Trypanosoma cruzi]|uniref:Uncharacterized protein n=1 Tax=Trypanosoma cruzi TaxID=5693 RepID=A0A2V2UP11_TRYCR|nr:hypothetical protein C4B63_259g12 [Trypanosoma cruzi]